MRQTSVTKAATRVVFATLFTLVWLVPTGGALAAGEEIVRTYEFAVDNWKEIAVEDGAVTLHRIRLDHKEDRVTQATLARRPNEEYLQPIRFQLEYSNSSTAKKKVRIKLSWLDEEGRVIDGFGAAESLQKQSARRTVQASVATLKYGLEQAATLQVEIRFEPQ